MSTVERSIVIRKASIDDSEKLAPIMLLAMEEIVYQLIGRENKTEAIHFLHYFIARNDNQYSYQNIWVAEQNGQLLGQICLYDGGRLEELRRPVLDYIKKTYLHEVDVENETQAGEIYLDTIAVSPKAQGQGIGKILLSHVIDDVVAKNNTILGLLVDEENPSAKSLYIKMGFQVVARKILFGRSMEHLQIGHPISASD